MGGHKREISDSHMPLRQSEVQATFDGQELQVYFLNFFLKLSLIFKIFILGDRLTLVKEFDFGALIFTRWDLV